MLADKYDLYKKVYFHATKRAMLENENYMKSFMIKVAANYDYNKLLLLDRFLTEIEDNCLFNLIMKKDIIFSNKCFREIIKDIVNFKTF